MTAQELWQAYIRENPVCKEAAYDAWSYGSDIPEELTRLTLAGIKTATASLYQLYEYEKSEVPKEGTYSVLLDTEGNALCILMNTAVTIVPFCKVTERQAYREGEGDRSLSYWRQVHRSFFTQELSEIGMAFSEDMLVVCEEFEIVYRASKHPGNDSNG